jgi:hypothetical protein
MVRYSVLNFVICFSFPSTYFIGAYSKSGRWFQTCKEPQERLKAKFCEEGSKPFLLGWGVAHRSQKPASARLKMDIDIFTLHD